MPAPDHRNGSVYQIAFVVDDLEAAAQKWHRLGAGPFYLFEDFRFADIKEPAGGQSPHLSILLGYSGDTLIELIKVHEDKAGIFDGVGAGHPHHVAVLVRDIEEFLTTLGKNPPALLFHGHFPTGTAVAYLDTRPDNGLITELVTKDSMVVNMLEQMYRDASYFNGTDLIRTF